MAGKATPRPEDTAREIQAPPVVFRAVADLLPYARNARTHSEKQVAEIAASIVEWGWTNPVLADATGVVAGHGRLAAARLLYGQERHIRLPGGDPVPFGYVPVIDVSGWSDTKRRAYILADNQLALRAGWDDAMLSTELQALVDDGVDLSLMGFDDDVLKGLGVDVEEGELPELDSGDKPPFQQMTFTLHDTQVEVVREAMERATAIGPFAGPNENSNGNAIARVCELFLGE